MDKAVPDQWASPARKNSCCLFKETLQHAEQNKNIFFKKKKNYLSQLCPQDPSYWRSWNGMCFQKKENESCIFQVVFFTIAF